MRRHAGVVKWTIIAAFEAVVPGSSPGTRAINLAVVKRTSHDSAKVGLQVRFLAARLMPMMLDW
jgi:hypothetical protein